MPVFEQLAKTHRFRLKVIGAGNAIPLTGVEVDHRPWNLETEAEEFRDCDIGIYPLWDDIWSRGKCGFKALQFMASGVPVIAASVGVNTEIIQDGVNGLLAYSPDQWQAALSQLLDNTSLRRQFAVEGCRTIEERFSLSQMTPKFLGFIRETVEHN